VSRMSGFSSYHTLLQLTCMYTGSSGLTIRTESKGDVGRHQNDMELQFVHKQVKAQAGLDLTIVTAGQGRIAIAKSLL
jgi:hypothetical protein